MLLFRILAFGIFIGALPGQRLTWSLRISLIFILVFLLSPYLFVSSTEGVAYSLFRIEDEFVADSFSPFHWLSSRKSMMLQELAWGVWLGVCVSAVFYALSFLASWARALLGLHEKKQGHSVGLQVAMQLFVVHLFLQLDGAALLVEYFSRSLILKVEFGGAIEVVPTLLFITGNALKFAAYLGLPLFFLGLLIEFLLILPVRYFPDGFSSSLLTSVRIPALCLLSALLVYPFVDLISAALRESLSAEGFTSLLQRIAGG